MAQTIARRALAWALPLLVGGVGGCAVDQAREVATYRALLDARLPATQPADPARRLTLAEALALANADSERLAIEGETYLQALIGKARVVATVLPALSLAPELTYLSDVTSGSQTRLEAPLSASLGGMSGLNPVERLAALARQELTAQERLRLLRHVQTRLLVDTARAYYRVLLAERTAEVVDNSVKVQEDRVRDIQTRLRVGVARPLDVAQIEAQLAATRVTRIRAREEVATGRELLAFLTATPVQQAALTEQALAPAAPPPVDHWLAVARLMRDDLRAADFTVAAAEQDIRRAAAQYLPTLSLDFEHALVRLGGGTGPHLTGMLALELPLFTAGRIHAEVREAWSRYRQEVLRRGLLRRQVEQEVRTAQERLRASTERGAELQAQVRASAEALRQAEAAYSAGLGTNLERLVAQDRLLAAQLDQTTERFNREVLYLELLSAAGELEPLLRPAAAPGPTTTAPRPAGAAE